MTTYLEFIRPAMIHLAREVEPRAYRREPCFRMHIVASVGPMLLVLSETFNRNSGRDWLW